MTRTSEQGIAANAKAPLSALPPTPLSCPRASTIVCPAAHSSSRKRASTPVRPRRRLVVAPASEHRPPPPRRRLVVAPTSEHHRWPSDDRGGADSPTRRKTRAATQRLFGIGDVHGDVHTTGEAGKRDVLHPQRQRLTSAASNRRGNS